MENSNSFNRRKFIATRALAVPNTGFSHSEMNFVHAYGAPIMNRDVSIKTIRHAYDQGVRFFDTAEVYDPFKSEELVGEAFKAVRKDVVISTKFGVDITADGRALGKTSRPEHIKRVCEESLRRLVNL